MIRKFIAAVIAASILAVGFAAPASASARRPVHPQKHRATVASGHYASWAQAMYLRRWRCTPYYPDNPRMRWPWCAASASATPWLPAVFRTR